MGTMLVNGRQGTVRPASVLGTVVKKSWWLPVLKYVLGFGLLAVVVWFNWRPGGGRKGLADALKQPIHFVPLLLGAALYTAGLLVTFVRWFLLVRAQGLPFTLPNALRLGMIGNYFNTFLPGSVGGDIIKATFIAREQDRRTAAVATVILDRVIGLCGLLWVVALLGGTFWATGVLETLPAETLPAAERAGMVAWLQGLTGVALGVVAGSVLFWLALGRLGDAQAQGLAAWLGRRRWVGPALAECWGAVYLYRRRGRAVGLALVMSMVAHLGFIAVFYCAARTLTPADELPALGMHFLFVPFGMTAQALFVTPGGVGGAELVYGELYRAFGAAFSAGVLASLIKRVIDWGTGLLGYLVYLRLRPALPAAAAVPTEHLNGYEAAAAPHTQLAAENAG